MRYAFEILNTPSLTESERTRYQQSIEHSIQDLDHLIDQTLQLSRYDHDREQIRFSEQVLSHLLQKECDHVALANPSLFVTFNVESLVQTQTAWIDPTAIRRAVNNLLSNACRYTATSIAINLNHDTDKEQWVIDVHDDGPGIPPEYREQIFNPFIQLNNASRTKETGHGLGLAIVQQIARWHHGQVAVRDSPMGGACFTLRWPCHPESLLVSN
jgi:two-component system sensor histidine kinase RstB